MDLTPDWMQPSLVQQSFPPKEPPVGEFLPQDILGTCCGCSNDRRAHESRCLNPEETTKSFLHTQSTSSTFVLVFLDSMTALFCLFSLTHIVVGVITGGPHSCEAEPPPKKAVKLHFSCFCISWKVILTFVGQSVCIRVERKAGERRKISCTFEMLSYISKTCTNVLFLGTFTTSFYSEALNKSHSSWPGVLFLFLQLGSL